MSKYPRMMYRKGGEIEWEGKTFDTLVAADEDEEKAAAKEGWRVSPDPLDHDGDGQPGGSEAGEKSTRKRSRKKKSS